MSATRTQECLICLSKAQQVIIVHETRLAIIEPIQNRSYRAPMFYVLYYLIMDWIHTFKYTAQLLIV